MPTQPLVPDPRQVHLLAVVAESASIVLQMRTCSASAPCPVCGRPSRTRAFLVSSDAGRSALGWHPSAHSALVPPFLL